MNIKNGQYAISNKTGRVVKVMSYKEVVEYCDVMSPEVTKTLKNSEFEIEYELIAVSSMQEMAIIRMKELVKNAKDVVLVFNGQQFEFKDSKDSAGFSELMKSLNEFSKAQYPKQNIVDGSSDAIMAVKNMILNRLVNSDSMSKRIRRVKSKDSSTLRFGPEDLMSLSRTKEEEMVVLEPSSRNNWEKLILANATKHQLEKVMVKLELGNFLNEEWGLSELSEKKTSQTLNFQGPPGTGKTLAAKSLAYKLNKKILQVDYSQLYSKYVGESGKNIQKYFQKAQAENLILFFDEADALVSSREKINSDPSANTNKNIFMQELDKFDGLVILTTNYFSNYDTAMVRRMENIAFELPESEQRQALFKSIIPSKLKLIEEFDWDLLVRETQGFSGGDIKNVIQQGITQKATNIRLVHKEESAEKVAEILRTYVFSAKDFMTDIKNIKQNKNLHAGKSSNDKKLGLVG